MFRELLFRRLYFILIFVSSVVYSQITLTLPTVSGINGSEIQNAAITISDLTGKNITSFQFQINYDPNIIEIYGINSTGTLSSSIGPTPTIDNINGLCRIGGYATDPMSGSGTLLYLKIRIKASSGSTVLTYAATGQYTNGETFISKFGNGSNIVTAIDGLVSVGTGYTINITTLNGTVTKSPSQTIYPAGSTVTLTASTTVAGYSFGSWSGDASGTVNPLTVTMNGNKNITANFVLNTSPTLNFNPAGPSFPAAEGSALSIQLLGTDADAGDILSYSFTSTPTITGASFNANSGVFSWTPVTNQAGTYSVVFAVTDGKTTTTKNATIVVAKTNLAPALTLSPAGPYTVLEGNALTPITLNGTDPNSGDVLIYSFSSTPTMTGASLNATTKVFSWSTNVGQAGTYNVTFSVSDGQLTTNVLTTITVTSINTAPTLTLNPSGPYAVDEGSTLSFKAEGKDIDVGNVLTYSLTSTPEMAGSNFSTSTGSFSWSPTTNQAGIYNVTFSVSDGKLTTSVSTKITVNKVNLAPTLTLDPKAPYLVYESETLQITLLGVDPNTGDVLTFSITSPTTLPAGSKLVNNIFTWTPDYGMGTNSYNFTFKVQDQSGLSASVPILIVVGKKNRAPVFTTTLPAGLVCTVNKPTPLVFSFTYKATDPDNDKLTFTLISGPPNASITTDGVFSWGPTVDQVKQNYVVTVQVSDGSLSAQNSQIIYASDVITAVKNYSGIPTEYSLFQNYPNPFNPTTTINYSLPKEGFVKLTVYDLLGKEIALLVNTHLSAGYHSVEFDASRLQSGLYLYQIQANDFVAVKKMMLMK